MSSVLLVCVMIASFLNWVDRPVLEHEVVEAHIPNGALLLGVTVGDTMQKLATIQCLDAAGAVELIARSASLGQLETLSAIENSTTSEVPINAPGLVA